MIKKPSYEQINYSLRPGKHIERKIIVEGLQRLAAFDPLSNYKYIGFGSIYFVDFALFHKVLGIANMVSIERDSINASRFEFNKPFKCINLRFGSSSSVLPTLDWSGRSIVWLDYDGVMQQEYVADVSTFCSEANSGSVLLVTVNVSSYHLDDPADALSNFRKSVGKNNVPNHLKLRDVQGKRLGETCRAIFERQIQTSLHGRNLVLPAEKQYLCTQIYNIRYSDGAKMATYGWILYSAEDLGLFKKCEFQNLAFSSSNNLCYEVRVPRLTSRELRLLDSQLPCADIATIQSEGIPEDDIKGYANVYRYFPNYSDVEV